jgi:hypothetical protein
VPACRTTQTAFGNQTEHTVHDKFAAMNELGAQLHPDTPELEFGLPFNPEATTKWRVSASGQKMTLNPFRLNSGGHSSACVNSLRQACNVVHADDKQRHPPR